MNFVLFYQILYFSTPGAPKAGALYINFALFLAWQQDWETVRKSILWCVSFEILK